MAATLPYTFDTRGVTHTLLRGALLLELVVVVPGIVYSLFVSHDPVAVGLLVFIGGFVLVMGVLIARYIGGSSGTITATSVDVIPPTFYGIRLPGPSGRYPMDQFTAVRVERVSAPIDPMVQGREHTRVYIVAGSGQSDVLIARAAIDEGVAIGNGLGAALRLPCNEVSRSY